MADSATHRAIEAVYRTESPRLIAGLMRIVRDVGLAEELAQDALVIALEKWPTSGIPDNAGAWLMTTAKNRAINAVVRKKSLERKYEELEVALQDKPQGPDIDEALDDEVGDDLLRLIFISCHPVLPEDARAALTLRLLGGLSTEEIARAFLAPEPTIAQRIVRAKRTLAEERVPFEVPRGEDIAARLQSVLAVIYLVFNEGYSATAGDDVQRPALREEALRLGRILEGLMPESAEVHGLVALMELHSSRSAARLGPSGEHVLLLEQERWRWDHAQIARGLTALERAAALGGERGAYVLQAEISACHARAKTAAETDWARIARLYAELGELTDSPVVELNRAVAVAMAGPAAGLAILDRLSTVPALAGYHLLSSACGDLLAKLSRWDEARAELERAASLTLHPRERALLLARAEECAALAAQPRPER